MSNLNEMAVLFPKTFKIGLLAQEDSGGARLKRTKYYSIPRKWREAVSQCEEFIRRYGNRKITKKAVKLAGESLEVIWREGDYGKFEWCDEENLVGTKILYYFGEQSEIEELARVIFKDCWEDYLNYDSVINEIFDGELSNCIEADEDAMGKMDN